MQYDSSTIFFRSPSPIYHKVNPSPVRQYEIVQVQVQLFLKIKLQNILTVKTLMNEFGKTFVLTFL